MCVDKVTPATSLFEDSKMSHRFAGFIIHGPSFITLEWLFNIGLIAFYCMCKIHTNGILWSYQLKALLMD